MGKEVVRFLCECDNNDMKMRYVAISIGLAACSFTGAGQDDAVPRDDATTSGPDSSSNTDAAMPSDSALPLDAVDCSAPFMKRAHGCYYFETRSLTRLQAIGECALRSARLVKIETNAEDQDLSSAAPEGPGLPTRWWIGLNVVPVGAMLQFFWLDTTQAVYTNFRDGQPSPGETCVVTRREMPNQKLWGGRPCAESHGSICEK